MRARCLKVPDKYAHKWCAHALQSLQSFKKSILHIFDSPHVWMLSFILCSDWLWQHINVSVYDTHHITTTNRVSHASNTLKYTQMLVYTLLILMSIDSNQPLTFHFSSPSFSTPPSSLLSQGYRCRYRLCMADQSQPTFSRKYWHSGFNP